MCAKISVIVNELKKDYKDKVTFNLVKVDAETKKEMLKSKLKSHGIVGKNKKGEIVMIVEGHKFKKPKILEVIKKITE
jgi:hypothetical protein